MSEDVEGVAWPPIGASGVAGVCDEICACVHELEEAFRSGRLASELAAIDYGRFVGPHVLEVYRRLVDEVPGPMQDLRWDAVQALLVQLRNDLVPTTIATAEPVLDDEAGPDDEPEGPASPVFPARCLARIADGPATPMRRGQMLDAAFWGIGFAFPTPELDATYGRLLVFGNARRLGRDILGVKRVLDRFRPSELRIGLRIVPAVSERSFEHLMLDILNEDGRCARMATIQEDFLEKTDMRVRYASVERRKGARVQVTSTISPSRHRAKLESIRHNDEFVFLSPLSLAEFACRRLTSPASASEHASVDPDGPWNDDDMRPGDVGDLAFRIRTLLFEAMEAPPTSPLGPMAAVPVPVRRLVRTFAEASAVLGVGNLRRRRSIGAPVGSDGSASRTEGLEDDRSAPAMG